MKPLLSIILCCLMWGQSLWAHGEDKPGPNKGYIRMPGAFHTELVPEKKGDFKIYLLDFNWKNPSVKDSKLEVALLVGGKTLPVDCKLSKKYYNCQLPKGFDLSKGELEVMASRENAPGTKVTYPLPLSFESAEKKAGDSHNHHQHNHQHHNH